MKLVQTEQFIINQDSLEQQFKDQLVDTDITVYYSLSHLGCGKVTSYMAKANPK